MIDNRQDLSDALWDWLKKGDTLTEARRFLSAGPNSKRSGLGDSQLANWRRKEHLPDTFLEGAALYHCAQARSPRIDAAEETGLAASDFWQVFVVGNPSQVNQPRLDCAILRYWQNARAVDDNRYLSHYAYRSIAASAAKGETHDNPTVTELGGTDTRFYREFDDDGSLFVSWEIDREPRDHGYAVTFADAIKNDHDELVGGAPTIAVDSAHLLAFLPKKAIERLAGRGLPHNPQGIPGAFATHLSGNPARVMERYLGILESDANGDFRRLGPWFRMLQQVGQGEGDVELPAAVTDNEIYKEAAGWVDTGEFRLYSLHVDLPVPILTYALVF